MSSISNLTISNNRALAGNILLWEAIVEANRVHRNQKTNLGGGWYIPHPLHLVMIHLQCGFVVSRQDDLNILITDTQHDTVEDCPKETNWERIEKLFGQEVRRMTKAVTHDEGYNPHSERERILLEDWKVQSVKLADVAANSLRIAEGIKQKGLVEIQRFLKQPLQDRCDMEAQFVTKCLNRGNTGPARAKKVRAFAVQTICHLRDAVSRATS